MGGFSLSRFRRFHRSNPAPTSIPPPFSEAVSTNVVTSSASPCYILNLPIPLFDSILLLAIEEPNFTYFPKLPSPEEWDQRTRTLLSCSLVSQAFCARSQRLLWMKVRMCDDKSAKMWLKSGGTRKWDTESMALQKMDLRLADKVVRKVRGLRVLELYFLDGLDMRVLGYPSLNHLTSLVLATGFSATLTKTTLKIPYIIHKTRTQTISPPILPFSLQKLWLNTAVAAVPPCLSRSLLLASASTLEEFEARADRGTETTNSAYGIGVAMLQTGLPQLRKLQMDGEIVSKPLLNSLIHSTSLSSIFLDGSCAQLFSLLESIPSPTRELGMKVELAALYDVELDYLEDRLRELKDLGVECLKVHTRDGLHWPEKNGFRISWNGRALPSQTFEGVCERVGLRCRIVVDSEEEQ